MVHFLTGVLSKLTEVEFVDMQRHTVVGYDILRESKSSLLQLAAEIAGSHHERWDGEGYPFRLAGEAIPLSGRIDAIADTFDALTTARPYKDAWPLERTVEHIRACAGSQFDPEYIDASDRALGNIVEIMERDKRDSAAQGDDYQIAKRDEPGGETVDQAQRRTWAA